MTRIIFSFTLLFFSLQIAFAQSSLRCRTGHVYIKSTNAVMNLEANNFQVHSTLDTETGAISFIGLSKSFQWEKGALDQIFASDQFDISAYPKFTYEGEIKNIDQIDFSAAGTYHATIDGYLIIGDARRRTKATAIILVAEDLTVSGKSDLSFTIEQANVDKINALLKSKTGANMERLKISEKIIVKANFNYR